MFFFFFFFQAEDGIRDPLVTGVQTCALPIWVARWKSETAAALSLAPTAFIPKLYACRASRDGVVACSKGVLYFWMVLKDSRSEERRVGKECRLRVQRDQYKTE